MDGSYNSIRVIVLPIFADPDLPRCSERAYGQISIKHPREGRRAGLQAGTARLRQDRAVFAKEQNRWWKNRPPAALISLA